MLCRRACATPLVGGKSQARPSRGELAGLHHHHAGRDHRMCQQPAPVSHESRPYELELSHSLARLLAHVPAQRPAVIELAAHRLLESEASLEMRNVGVNT